MISIEKINLYLEENLSPKRYRHSLGVAEESTRLAKRYGADENKAYIAGLVHDCAKEIKEEKAKSLLKDTYGIEVDPVTEQAFKLLHGPLGACMAKDIFEISDEEIFDAIRYHTTAKADMSLLTKIIYIADYIEPNRDFDGVDMLRRLAYEDINKAIIVGLDYTLTELIEAGRLLHLDTVEARNFLLTIEQDK